MYPLFNQYLEAHKKGIIDRQAFSVQLQQMGKDEESRLLLLDQFEFDANKFSTFDKETTKAKRLLWLLSIVFFLLVSITLLIARFNFIPNQPMMAIAFSIAAPIYGISRALYSLRLIKKSKVRILQKWKSLE
ncbi:hypothetical protein SAMN05216474_1680 [Lishizhenia tianjinensis]|uniref:Uncharacterized protein n=1 Tax=Lishizhenia tianjinensis TaxID=477690 RepID=A0A1I6ZWT0_9FLAO|nr:hypothetical protein [Lishizhenia tianjinensis]SFT67095.1 hypothetical protein SAMN05216474_1680 [Lishizhenia tianjinensis]